MKKIIYLTASEKKMFDALSSSARGDILVESEGGIPADAEQKRKLRFELLRPQSPAMVTARKSAMSATSSQELANIVQGLDISQASEDDLLELLYALGPVSVTHIIEELLHTANLPDDVELAAGLTCARHAMIAA